jgi:hypothetical protein
MTATDLKLVLTRQHYEALKHQYCAHLTGNSTLESYYTGLAEGLMKAIQAAREVEASELHPEVPR